MDFKEEFFERLTSDVFGVLELVLPMADFLSAHCLNIHTIRYL